MPLAQAPPAHTKPVPSTHQQTCAEWAETLHRFDRPGPRYTSYPTAREFTHEVGPLSYKEHLGRVGASHAPISLYVHLPFCRQQCLYCACNMVVSGNGRGGDRYLTLLEREMGLVRQALGDSPPVTLLHLGGGTPTWHAPDALDRLLQNVAHHFDLDPHAERSIEVDPRITTRGHLTVLRRHGFQRLSLGVQDLHTPVQTAIRRIQPLETVQRLIDDARKLGFSSVNADLIYGLPHQTPESFAATAEAMVELGVERLAVYGFAYVPWMKKHQRKLPEDALPVGIERLGLLESARAVLLESGYVDIGMDHFALPHDDLAVARQRGTLRRNFMGYTTDTAEHLVGLGVSSISDVHGALFQNESVLHQWQKRIESGALATHRGVLRSEEDRARAEVIEDLMCHFRILPGRFESRTRRNFSDAFSAELPALSNLESDGLLERRGEDWYATELGTRLVRNIAMVFDTYRHADAEEGFSRTV